MPEATGTDRCLCGEIARGRLNTLMPLFVGLALALLILIASGVVAIFSLRMGAISYTAAIFVMLAIISISCLCVRVPDGGPDQWQRLLLSPEEERMFRKHRAFFFYPFGAQTFAHFINFARMLAGIWLVISIWQGWYWIAGTLVLFYAISAPMMVWLEPMAHYKSAAAKGHLWATKKLAQIEHILGHRETLGF
jgi:hypothetical protein